jgi:hypothetical protein
MAWANPLEATVVDSKDEGWENPAAPVLAMSSMLLTVANSVQVADDGSYWLGTVGIAFGVAGLVASGELDERSTLIDVPSALSITTGALSILRRVSYTNSKTMSIAPEFGRSGVGASLTWRF